MTNDHLDLDGQRVAVALRHAADGLGVSPQAAVQAARAGIASGQRIRRRRRAAGAVAGTCLMAVGVFTAASLLSGQTTTTTQVPTTNSAPAADASSATTRADELAAGITAQQWLAQLPASEAHFWPVPGSDPTTVNWNGREYRLPEGSTPSWAGMTSHGVLLMLGRNNTTGAPSPVDVRLLLPDGSQKALAAGLAPEPTTVTDGALFSWNKAGPDDAITATRIDLATGARTSVSVAKSPGALIGVSDRGVVTQQGGVITRTAAGARTVIGSRVPDLDANHASDLTAFLVADADNASCRAVVDPDGQSLGKPLCTPLPEGARSFVSPGGVWVIEDGYLVRTSTGQRFRMAPQGATAGRDLAWSWESTDPDIAFTEVSDTARVVCRLSTGTCTRVTVPS